MDLEKRSGHAAKHLLRRLSSHASRLRKESSGIVHVDLLLGNQTRVSEGSYMHDLEVQDHQGQACPGAPGDSEVVPKH